MASSSISGEYSRPNRSTWGSLLSAAGLAAGNLMCPSFNARNCLQRRDRFYRSSPNERTDSERHDAEDSQEISLSASPRRTAFRAHEVEDRGFSRTAFPLRWQTTAGEEKRRMPSTIKSMLPRIHWNWLNRYLPSEFQANFFTTK